VTPVYGTAGGGGMMDTMKEITDVGGRYELSIDGAPVGRCVYRDAGARRTFSHTEIDADHAGQGLATELVAFALADVRRLGMRIVSECPMVTRYLERHHDLDDIVDRPAGVDGVDDIDGA
jgi:predicted GNAT family acetyltransferase